MATTVMLPLRPAPAPDQQPRYARPVLIVITAVAALLYAWDIQHSQFHPFYADAVRSMAGSWRAFLYGAFDPGNTITLDKLPGFLWPQALSARLFGFHPWALTLPQVIEGVLSVLVLHRAVRRWAGTNAALLAAAFFTLTPVVAGLFRTAVEDPAFTLFLLLAADATQRAARAARLRSLLLAGCWIGFAFQAKMLEAFAVLPVLALVYLLSAPTALRRRLVHLVLAGTVTLAVSASWMLLITLTPAQDRPYVDGTTDNSAVSMVVGYNFLNRFSSVGMNAADTGSVSAVRAGGGYGHGHDSYGQGPMGDPAREDGGWHKMLAGPLASQTGWFYPLGLAGLGLGLHRRRREPRTDPARAGFLLWGGWFAVYFLVFSAGSVAGHTYYMGVVAAPLAALSGAGLVLLWRAHQGRGLGAWALPATVAATGAWAAYVAGDYPAFLPGLGPVVLLLAGASVLLLAVPLVGPSLGGRARAGRFGAVAGLAAILLAPAAWTASVFNAAYGHSAMGAVGPPARHLPFARSGAGAAGAAGPWAALAAGFAGPAGGEGAGGTGRGSSAGVLTSRQRALIAYAEAHRGGARYLFATTSWTLASPYILAADARVLPIGGFTDQVPSPTLGALQRQVSQGKLRYVLIADTTSGDAAAVTATAGTAAAQATRWVSHSCAPVPPGSYGGGVAGVRLYHCRAAAR
ncbi:4-amino-4-deoxy-L-arabinose transferase-like glycosyltransferase [Streptacidiphilus sp. MAP12-16]|uniref:ArnT family glycosyltransferase n=1 Tax=Streptacidiphilus sp. MAP12-16 TaxID=3156300 RepID=UPI0035111C3F